MHLLWENPPQTITQITKLLEGQKGFSKNVVITYLKRLEERELFIMKEEQRQNSIFLKLHRMKQNKRRYSHFWIKYFMETQGCL